MHIWVRGAKQNPGCPGCLTFTAGTREYTWGGGSVPKSASIPCHIHQARAGNPPQPCCSSLLSSEPPHPAARSPCPVPAYTGGPLPAPWPSRSSGSSAQSSRSMLGPRLGASGTAGLRPGLGPVWPRCPRAVPAALPFPCPRPRGAPPRSAQPASPGGRSCGTARPL